METKITTVTFQESIRESQLSLFRGAVMAYAGMNSLYHNHSEDGKDIFQYPRIQYKILNGAPAIVGYREGADSLEQLFHAGDVLPLSIGSDEHSFTITGKFSSFFVPGPCTNGPERYFVKRWLPLNRENYDSFRELESLSAKYAFLDNILVGNILSLYTGLDTFLTERVNAFIARIEQVPASYKGVKMIAYDIDIVSSIRLPENLGLGKGVSKGFGTITPMNKG